MSEQRVLQFCHGYDGPFLDCARQYAALFQGTRFKVTTVYLTGEPDERVRKGSASDDVIFLGYGSKAVRGLKLGAIRDIRRIAAERDFAYCIAHRSKPTYVALLGTQLPVIGVHHAFGDFERRSRRTFANLFRKRLFLLGVSNAVRDDVRQCLPEWPQDRIQTLYNRIDVETVQAEQINRVDARTQLDLPSQAWIVGNVGRLHPDKDQATLIRAFATALPNLPAGAMLTILGQGRLEAELKALAAALNVDRSVRFLGQVQNARRYFKAFDQFVLTSDHEPFGMVLLEAMAAGLPIICTDCGGAPEVVAGVGETVPLKSSQVLADTLVRQSKSTDRDPLVTASMLRSFSDEVAKEQFQQLVAGWSL